MKNRKLRDVLAATAACLLLALGAREFGAPLSDSRLSPDFRLKGQGEKLYSRASFPEDSSLVVYFGYTHCWKRYVPALNEIAMALESLGDAGKRVFPIFFSLDPEREGLAEIEDYLQAFGPRFIGLTGERDDVLQTATEFGVPVERLRFSDAPTDYAMKHDSPILILAPGRAELIRVPVTATTEELKAAIVSSLKG
jgi:protein SCO1/2